MSGPGLVRDLRRRMVSSVGSRGTLDALIEAGQLEAALADAGCASAACAVVTDALASVLCTGSPPGRATERLLEAIEVPSHLNVSPPEGFTYYALHPADFARLAARIPRQPRTCAVIGIRSIGATLSAVVAAALRSEGRPATRITVRPTGHPYARITAFNAGELGWIHHHLQPGAQFLIVDEGPGRSGSTFLSVAEALLRAGVPREKILMLGSREPSPDSLCAEQAASRWRSFQFFPTSPVGDGRFHNHLYAGGGDWRRLFLPQEEFWPECWVQMERLKFVSPDLRRLYKFEGMGPIGAEARERAFQLADAGFAPPAADAGDGFVAYELVPGRRLRPPDISTALLDRMAAYCAFRRSSLAVPFSEPSQLREMTQFNLLEEFGFELSLGDDAFSTEQPVVVDGQMQPHEWIAAAPHQFLKTDGVDHGDNHFFPGPCDIAWDLAGIAVEWRLAPDALRYLANRFRQLSGVDLFPGLSLYVIAYCIFRMGFCRMAISTARGTSEEPRLRAAYSRYRAEVQQLLNIRHMSVSSTAA
jgi:hypothetical protein